MCDILQPLKNELQEIEDDSLDPIDKTDFYKPAEPSLFTLPVEVLLQICSFLDAEYITQTLSKVCKRFEDIFSDVELWKYWVSRRMKATYPALPHLKIWEQTEPNWQEACIEIDRESKRWSNVKETMKHIVVKDVHFASVDTVLLVNNGEICVSGGRDRGIALWKVLSILPQDKSEDTTTITNSKPVIMRHDAHSGWVWDLAADSSGHASVVYSASWDNTVKAWDLESSLTCIQQFRCGMAALSVVTSDNMVFAGLYSKKVLAFDIRVGAEAVCSYSSHKGPVLALDYFKNKIASVSEDRTLAVWDRVAGKVLASDVTMQSEKKSYPVCISWSDAAMYIGDSEGSLHLIDPEQLTYYKTHEIWPKSVAHQARNKISGIHQNFGSMIVCSDRGEIKFLYNSFPPQEYTSVRTSTLDVTQLQYQNDVLVLGTCDSALEFWVPADRYD